MLNFNLGGTSIYSAVKTAKLPTLKFAKPLKRLFLLLFLLAFLLFSYGFFPENFPVSANRILLGASFVFLTVFLFFWIAENFLNLKIKNPIVKIAIDRALEEPEKHNLAECLSFESAQAVHKSLKLARGVGVNSNQLLYFVLRDNLKLNFVFYRALLNAGNILKDVKKEIGSPAKLKDAPVFDEDFQNTIIESLKVAQKRKHQRIEIGDMLSGLARCNPVFKRILVSSGLKAEDIENLTLWLETVQEKARKRKRFWEYEKLARGGTLAKEWVAGYTVNLDKYSVDLTEQIKGSAAEFIAHKEEVKIAERALCRREINNVLIVGESGSGRKSIIYGLAQKSLFGRCLPELNYKRFVELDMTALTAQIQASEQFEATLDTIFKEAVSAGNVVLVINEFHNFVGETPKPGIVDISGIITPYLRLSHFQIIGVTTFEGLHRNIEKNSSLLSLFEKIEVSNVPPEETLLILESLVPSFERKHKVFISYQALRDIISMTDRYLPALTFPEKAIDVLDQVVIYTSSATREKVVLPKHVAKIITEKSEIPVGEIDMKERNVLLNLEKLIHQRIINQDEAVKEISTAMRRARSEVTIRKGPIGCFLFLGPTGVGKTETSKALAEFYFGSEKRMIRLDMSEFQEIKDISRLIGSSEETGLLTTPVKETPFSLLLLDEIEKANSNILNLFLQVLDEGHLTDGFGRKVDFKNTIIIATSNAGYQIILEAIKQQSEWSGVKPRLLDYLFQEQIFRPEFINRFDAVVVFKPLSKENLLDIAQLLLSGLKKNLQDKGIEFLITEPLKEKIVELSYKPMFGAREMKRVIQDKVENILATALLSGKLKRGEIVGMDPKDFSLIVNPTK